MVGTPKSFCSRNLFIRFVDEDSNLHSIGKTFDLHILVNTERWLIRTLRLFFCSQHIKVPQSTALKYLVLKQTYENVLLICWIAYSNSLRDRQRKMIRKIINVQHLLATMMKLRKVISLLMFFLTGLFSLFVDDQNSSSDPTSIFVTTINPDSSVTEEKKPIPSSTSNFNEVKEENQEQEQYKFVPLERKPEYTFTMLITGQGQEVLKSKRLSIKPFFITRFRC